METISIPKEEYEALQKYRAIVRVVEAAIHGNEWERLLASSETVAKELWDNKYDEVWNDI